MERRAHAQHARCGVGLVWRRPRAVRITWDGAYRGGVIGVPLSVLEVLAVDAGHGAADLVPGVLDVAQRAERLGYRRVWYAEHHSSPGLVDFPPGIVIAHAASVTSTIRVGSGGVLAPNHSPLSLAEQFGALASFHPGRIDLGVGRGPGTFDPVAARALRRGSDPATEEEYREDVAAILRYASEGPAVPEPWLLASSTAGASLAAALGLPLVVAHHIKPEGTAETVERYRDGFKPSRWCETPRLMLSVQTVCAETETAAAALARPAEVHRAALATGRGDQPLLDVPAASAYEFTAEEEEVVSQSRSYQVQGTAEVVASRLAEIAGRFEVDELMVYTPIVDSKDRARSLELVMQAAS
jgi:luciferase family oxidoreductase group 1